MWAHAIVMLLGVWLMAAPSALDYSDPARMNDWIVGPIVATIGCVALWEATRGCRWINFALGLWLVTAPWILGYESTTAIQSTATGLAIAALSLVRGRYVHSMGGGWLALWRREAVHR